MSLPLRNSRIKLSQGQLFWREVGQGKTLVFLHGAWRHSGQWLPVIQELSSQYHCLAPDLLGFGDSERPAVHYSVELEVECLAEYLDALRMRQVYLIGHSLGGWIAASYALKYLDQVQGLVLLSPEGVAATGKGSGGTESRGWLSAAWMGWVLRSLKPLYKLLKKQDQWQQLQQIRQQQLQCPTSRQLLFQRRPTEIRAEHLQDRLEWLKIPLLVLQGGQDSPAARAKSQAYAQLSPKANLQILPDGGSDLTDKAPDWIAEQIRQFVTAH